MIYIQLYPCFTRFECKLFLTDALAYLGGAADRCMIDNTSVIRLKGTGKDMIPVPEMAAFAERFDFHFVAHQVGDANRSARVEAPFHWVQTNFLCNRTFSDWDHLNQEALVWCDKVNAKYSNKLHASRRELFAVEALKLKRLPIWIPPVYRVHPRIVDAEGYVAVHGIRYSVPWRLIGRQMEVRESKDTLEIFDGARQVATHKRRLDRSVHWVTDPTHRPPRGQGRSKTAPSCYEQELLTAEPRLGPYVTALKQRAGHPHVALRRLCHLFRDYPREPFLTAVHSALTYGLFDLERLERMVLRHIAHDYFRVPSDPDPDKEGDVS
jgi:hypothetical protein